jgi:hypothetical protein
MKKVIYSFLAIVCLMACNNDDPTPVQLFVPVYSWYDLPDQLKNSTGDYNNPSYRAYMDKSFLYNAVDKREKICNQSMFDIPTGQIIESDCRTWYILTIVTYYGKVGSNTYLSPYTEAVLATESKMASIRSLIESRSTNGKNGSVILDFEPTENTSAIGMDRISGRHYRIVKNVR